MIVFALALTAYATGLQMIDGVGRPRATEANFRFACQDLVGRIGYHQEFGHPVDIERLGDALILRLGELRVSGRTIRRTERAKAEALFATLAWVTNADARCFEGRFQFSVTAMPKREWVYFIREPSRRSRPEIEHHTIEIARDGSVVVDGPGL